MQYQLKEELIARGYKLANILPAFNFDYYIAGNSLNAVKVEDIHDIDIFPTKPIGFIEIDGWPVVCQTRNAVTISDGKTTVQVCKYYHRTLEELVLSFDYTHIQVGFYRGEVFYTDDWVTANALHNSWYVGSEYPLSSVIRCLKYYKYGQIANGKAIFSIISAIADMVQRGYTSQEDFKNQIDAVDLGLVAESSTEIDELVMLYELLAKK
jgi:hypothetical protein